MPALYPEMWLTRVRQLLSFTDSAPWLDGIEEIDTEVIEMGSGSASEQNLIHIPLENFDVEVLLNNTSYPLGEQAFTDDEAVVKLDKWETKVTTLSDDQVMGASYKRIDNVTRPHTRALLENKFTKAIHALAPAANSGDTPVIETTGAVSGFRRRFVYEDLIALKNKCDDAKMPKTDRRLVLTSNHWNDLLLDRDRFANQLNNIAEGEVAPKIAGFKIYQYDANPFFHKDGGVWTKTAFAAITNTGVDFEASVVFDGGNVAKKTGLTKQYYSPASATPKNPVNELNYRHYFMTLPMRQKFMAAVVSPTANPAPYVQSVTPDIGVATDDITIEGFNLTGATAVNFGSTPGTNLTIVNDGKITVKVPSVGDDTYDLTVVTPEGTSNVTSFVVT